MIKTRLFVSTIAVMLAVVAVGCGKTNKINTPSTQAAPPAAGPVQLTIKWTPGEHIVQEIEIKQNMESVMPGLPAPMKTEMNIGQKISLTVVSADPDGGHQLELQFLSVSLDGEAGGKKLAFDSDKDQAAGSTDPVGQTMGKLVGVKLQYFLDASNKVVRIEGIDDLLSRFSGAASASLKSMFTEDYFKRMMDTTLYLPPNAVQPGDSWPVKIELPMGLIGTMNMDYTSTFKGWDTHGKRNCALIEVAGKMQIEPNASGSQRMSISVHNGTSSGMIWFDPEFGTVIDSDFNQDMTMLITVPKNRRATTEAASAETQTITNQMSQTIGFKVVSLN